MATVFRDKGTGKVLRVDYGNPDHDLYAKKEGLTNWEAVEMADADAKKLLPSGEGDLPVPGSLTLEERIKKLEDAVFKT